MASMHRCDDGVVRYSLLVNPQITAMERERACAWGVAIQVLRAVGGAEGHGSRFAGHCAGVRDALQGRELDALCPRLAYTSAQCSTVSYALSRAALVA